MTCLTFDKIAWAALFYRATSSDQIEYAAAGRKNKITYAEVVDALKSVPFTVEEDAVAKLVRFLNSWGRCRMRNNRQMRNRLRDRLQNLPKDLRLLPALEHAQFSDTTKKNVQKAYSTLRGHSSKWKVGPTAISKILHLVHPAFFVMWDKAIRTHYGREDTAIAESDRGYVAYLVKMKNMAQHAMNDFHDTHPSEDAALATFLSKRLGVSRPVPLTKFLDEYNWLKVTKGTDLPPKWHPCHA